MSIEKLVDDSRFIQEPAPYTMICNEVINHCKDDSAFRVWSYLYSKSVNWVVVKQDIKNVFGYGDKKMKKIFSYLSRANLIKYIQTTCANGRFAKTETVVLNGLDFDKNQPFNEMRTDGSKTVRAVFGTSGNDELLNKDITKKRKIQNKDRASDDAHARDSLKNQSLGHGDGSMAFDRFWNIYPRKKDKKRAQELWNAQKLDQKVEDIINCVQLQIRNDAQWKDERFIPYPTSYLRDERWKDEVNGKVMNNNKDEVYNQCVICKRPKLHCECATKYNSKQSGTADQFMKQIKVNLGMRS